MSPDLQDWFQIMRWDGDNPCSLSGRQFEDLDGGWAAHFAVDGTDLLSTSKTSMQLRDREGEKIAGLMGSLGRFRWLVGFLQVSLKEAFSHKIYHRLESPIAVPKGELEAVSRPVHTDFTDMRNVMSTLGAPSRMLSLKSRGTGGCFEFFGPVDKLEIQHDVSRSALKGAAAELRTHSSVIEREMRSTILHWTVRLPGGGTETVSLKHAPWTGQSPLMRLVEARPDLFLSLKESCRALMSEGRPDWIHPLLSRTMLEKSQGLRPRFFRS